MIHPRVLFLGDPAAATPWVGIAKKLARACYGLKIANKVYHLGSGVTIRVENTFPIAGKLAGISKVWIEAGSEIARFLVYPRDASNPRGFYSVSPLAFRHPGSPRDLLDLLRNPRYNNIAQLLVTPTSIKVAKDNLYQLSGNHFFYKRVYDEKAKKFVVPSMTLYSWLGSPAGDGGFSSAGGIYINSYSGTNAGISYYDANGTRKNVMRAIFKEGEIFKSFGTAEYPDLAYGMISGFSIKDIEYQDAYDNTQTFTVYLVAFTFVAGTAKKHNTEIHIYDLDWNELKVITLFDFGTYTYKPLYHPVRFNHDSTECVMINFYSASAFDEKVETAVCSLLYEANKEGELTVTENITRDIISIRGRRGSNIVPVQTTSGTRTTTTYDGTYTFITPQYPIAVNYNKDNEKVFVYYNGERNITYHYNGSVEKTYTDPGGTLVSTVTDTESTESDVSNGVLSFFGNEIFISNTYESSASLSYFVGVSTESATANETTSNTQQSATILYIDIPYEFLILCEASSAKSECSPSITYSKDGPSCEFNFSGVDYEIQTLGAYKIYQGRRNPKTIATYSDTETHSASAQGSSFSPGGSSETRTITLSYTVNCGSTQNSDSVSCTIENDDPLVYRNNSTRLTSFGVKIGWSSVGVYAGLDATVPLVSASDVDYGVVPIYGPSQYTIRVENAGSYYSTNVDTRGPFYGETYADFSYCVDMRVKFGTEYPWLMTYKLVHDYRSNAQYPPTVFPNNFTVLGAWTNGGYVQDISKPGRFNEFVSESLLLGPIGLY